MNFINILNSVEEWSVGELARSALAETSTRRYFNTPTLFSPTCYWRSPTGDRKQPISNGQGGDEYRYLGHNREPMKTLHTTDHNIINNTSHIRSALTVAGIVIAVLCLLTLWYEAGSSERMDTSAPHLLEFSRLVATDLVSEVKAWM
jgi:hypothetical protein